jgi:hypothetical protein
MNRRRALEKRLRALESNQRFEPNMITLPDGTVRTFFGSSQYQVSLLAAALGAPGLTSAQVADLDLLRRATTIRGASESWLKYVLAIANSPNE